MYPGCPLPTTGLVERTEDICTRFYFVGYDSLITHNNRDEICDTHAPILPLLRRTKCMVSH